MSWDGMECEIISRTFLGKYTNYFLRFADGVVLEDQPSIEYSQDLGHVDIDLIGVRTQADAVTGTENMVHMAQVLGIFDTGLVFQYQVPGELSALFLPEILHFGTAELL